MRQGAAPQLVLAQALRRNGFAFAQIAQVEQMPFEFVCRGGVVSDVLCGDLPVVQDGDFHFGEKPRAHQQHKRQRNGPEQQNLEKRSEKAAHGRDGKRIRRVRAGGRIRRKERKRAVKPGD